MNLHPITTEADEFAEPGAQVAHESSETRMDRRAPGGAEPDELNISILALDLGTHTGFACRRRDGTVLHGTENFTPRASWTPGQRWQRFRSWLSAFIVEHQVNAIAYEQVIQGGWKGGHENAGHKSGAAGDVYGGFKALVEMVADSHNLELHPTHVATVKKQFTGDGRAKKADVIAECKRRGFRPDTDNAADALAILDWAIARETGAWKPAPKRPKPKKRAQAADRLPRGRAAAGQPDFFEAR